MSVELLINVTHMETRVALVEQGILQEVHVERSAKLDLVGNIYKGKITRILPGMQAASLRWAMRIWPAGTSARTSG